MQPASHKRETLNCSYLALSNVCLILVTWTLKAGSFLLKKRRREERELRREGMVYSFSRLRRISFGRCSGREACLRYKPLLKLIMCCQLIVIILHMLPNLFFCNKIKEFVICTNHCFSARLENITKTLRREKNWKLKKIIGMGFKLKHLVIFGFLIVMSSGLNKCSQPCQLVDFPTTAES